MEPLTHLLTGACIARAGFNRKTAYATLALTLAAEAPDLDVFTSWAGPVAGFQHHRGFTHTLLGSPVVAVATVAFVYLLHRLWLGRRDQRNRLQPRWGLLFFYCWIASLSHLLLDFTNNYGVRPFAPFNTHWYAWDIVFIIDPIMLIVMIVALIAPALFGLINGEIGARQQKFAGRGWAIFALVCIVCYWGFRDYQHRRAIAALNAHVYDSQDENPMRAGAYPFPWNPFRWHGVVETQNTFVLLPVNTNADEIVDLNNARVLYKPEETATTLAAKKSWLGRVYLDWSRFPYVESFPVSNGATEVVFTDLRFAYETVLTKPQHGDAAGTRVLSGSVVLDRQNRVVEMRMGEHTQPRN